MMDEKDLQTIADSMDIRIRESENRMLAYFESSIMPKLDLIVEGQTILSDKMAPKSEIDELRGEIDLLKIAVRTMSKDIAELRKAQ